MKPMISPPSNRPPIIVIKKSHPSPILLTLAASVTLLTRAPMVAAETDAGIEASARKSQKEPARGNVTILGGVITLGGTATNIAQRDLVSRLVTDIIGVKSVINGIVIGTPLSRN